MVFLVVVGILGSRASKLSARAVAGYCTQVREGLSLNELASRIRCFAKSGDLESCKRVHEQVRAASQDSQTYLGNLLVEMYGKCGCLDQARLVFDGIRAKNVFSWTLVLAAHSQNGHYRAAIEFYWKMQLEGVLPDKFVISSVLSACSSLGAYREGKAVHETVLQEALQDTVVENALLTMYGKCGRLEDARRTFDGMQRPDIVSWNSMIAAYVHQGDNSGARSLFCKVQHEGVKPDVFTLTCILDACASEAEGRWIHELLDDCGGPGTDVLSGNMLIKMYGKFDRLDEARRVLAGMQKKDILSWTIMVAAYAQAGRHSEALKLFQFMDLEGTQPEMITFVSLLDSCGCIGNLAAGKQMHSRILDSTLEPSLVDCLVSMYAKCGSLEDAKLVFDRAPERLTGTWNAMLCGFAGAGGWHQALQLFRRMDFEGARPDKLSFYAVFDVCSSMKALSEARIIYSSSCFTADAGFESAAITMFSKVGSFEDAVNVFEAIPEKEVVCWNTILATCNQHCRYLEAVVLLREMDSEGFKPDKRTFASLLDACAALGNLKLGRMLEDRIVGSSGGSWNALINMYGKCRSLEDAKRVFDRAGEDRDGITWTVMVTAYAQDGHNLEALRLILEMVVEGICCDKVTLSLALDLCAKLSCLSVGRTLHSSIVEDERLEVDTALGNAVVNMYGKCGKLDEAKLVFEAMQLKDKVTWTSLVTAYAQQGHAEVALELFRRMQQEGLEVDTVVFVKVVVACGYAGLVEDAWQCLGSMVDHYGLVPEKDHYISLVGLLGRIGRTREAEDLIDSMPFEPDFVAWMALLNSCRDTNDSARAVRAARRLVAMEPKSSASYVLLSYIHAGETEEDLSEGIKVNALSKGG